VSTATLLVIPFLEGIIIVGAEITSNETYLNIKLYKFG
jgi:hypothetical protein